MKFITSQTHIRIPQLILLYRWLATWKANYNSLISQTQFIILIVHSRIMFWILSII